MLLSFKHAFSFWVFLLCINFFLSCLSLEYRVLDENRSFGKDILLIINYNYPYYQSIPFLKKIYRHYFPHIIFYGPKEDPSVELCKHFKGYFSYEALSLAMKKYPMFKGYLFVHDDCFINFWNLQRFDKDKIWICSGGLMVSRDLVDYNGQWMWWKSIWGISAYRKVYCDLSSAYKSLLDKNFGDKVLKKYSDVVYIPAKYQKETIELCNLCRKYNLFLEIAVPTICACLDYKENWEIISGIVLWKDKRKNPLEYYNKAKDFIHPLKFGSSPELCSFIEQQVKEVLGEYHEI